MPANRRAGYTMTRQSFTIPLLAFTLCLAPAAAMAQCDMRSTSQLLEELTSSFSNARAAETALKANLAQKNAYQSELNTVNRANAEYKRESSGYARDLARLTGEAAFSHCASRSSPEAQQQCILLAYQGSR
jgi:hypothetical protein